MTLSGSTTKLTSEIEYELTLTSHTCIRPFGADVAGGAAGADSAGGAGGAGGVVVGGGGVRIE